LSAFSLQPSLQGLNSRKYTSTFPFVFALTASSAFGVNVKARFVAAPVTNLPYVPPELDKAAFVTAFTSDAATVVTFVITASEFVSAVTAVTTLLPPPPIALNV
jgi:hypothetical protein